MIAAKFSLRCLPVVPQALQLGQRFLQRLRSQIYAFGCHLYSQEAGFSFSKNHPESLPGWFRRELIEKVGCVCRLSDWDLPYTVNMIEPQDQRSKPESPGEVTRLIRRWQSGSDAALEDLLPLVYAELRQIAGTYLAREDVEVSLQPTELVSETFLRLVRQGTAHADCRQHFFAAAAQMVRRLLVEAARHRQAACRSSALTVTLDDEMPAPAASADLLDIEAALEDLTKINERQARVVELRFFGGLTIPEVASISEVSVATTERDWSAARRWLRRRLASIRPMSEPT